MAQLFGKAKEFVANRSSGVPKPKVDFTDVSIKHVSGGSANFRSVLKVHNPYSHSHSDLRDLVLPEECRQGDCVRHDAGSGIDQRKRHDKARDSSECAYNFLISIMKDIGRDWDIDCEMCVGLTFDLPIISNFTLPVSKKGEMKLPTLSDMF